MWGVIWFVFHVLQLLPIYFYTTKLVLHEQFYDATYVMIEIENQTYPDVVVIIGITWLLISQLNTWVLFII